MSNFNYKTTSTPVRGKKFQDLLKDVRQAAFKDTQLFGNRLRKENYIYKGVNKEIQYEKRGTTQILSSTAQMEEERELRTFLGEPDEKKTNS